MQLVYMRVFICYELLKGITCMNPEDVKHWTDSGHAACLIFFSLILVEKKEITQVHKIKFNTKYEISY